jgi:hypothetical protein
VAIVWEDPTVQVRLCALVYAMPSTLNESPAGVVPTVTCTVARTVNTVEPETDPKVALMTLVPCPAPVASPPAVIVAVAVVAEAQVTEAARF